MDAAQKRVQDEVTKLIEDLDRDNFRKMQAKMYECSSKCCQNTSYSMNDVQRCIEACAVPVQRAQVNMENELSQFQNRLQRCAMDCQDKARDSQVKDNNDNRSLMESCMVKCVDNHIKLLPSIIKRVKETL